MASTITAATLTVKVTETISLNGAAQGASNTKTIASINEIDDLLKMLLGISPER